VSHRPGTDRARGVSGARSELVDPWPNAVLTDIGRQNQNPSYSDSDMDIDMDTDTDTDTDTTPTPTPKSTTSTSASGLGEDVRRPSSQASACCDKRHTLPYKVPTRFCRRSHSRHPHGNGKASSRGGVTRPALHCAPSAYSCRPLHPFPFPLFPAPVSIAPPSIT
jgi:hypothetical protein